MICKLAPIGCGCKHIDENGNCAIYLDEAVAYNTKQGSCVFRNIRADNVGIYAKKSAKKVRIGQQKQSKTI